MNKVLLISKAGEKIPFMIICCDSFESHEWGFFFNRDNEKHILHVNWDYFNVIDVKNMESDIIKNFEKFILMSNDPITF